MGDDERMQIALAKFQQKPIGEQLDDLTKIALMRKAQILGLPLPDDEDMSADAMRQRSIILSAADSTINQKIKVDDTAMRQRADDQLPQLLARIEAALKA